MPTYVPPGVYFQQETAGVFSSGVAIPSSVGLFGVAGLSRMVENVTLPADSDGTPQPVTLTWPNVTDLQLSVSGSGDELTEGTDFQATVEEGADGAPYTAITRLTGSTLLTGESDTVITASYQYEPAAFREAKRFNNPARVAAFYGPAFNERGEVQSPITLAAQMALANGAGTVILAAAQSETTSGLQAALDVLTAARDVSIVVPVTGSTAMHSATLAAVVQASNNELERRAIIGVEAATAATLTSAAGRLSSRRVALVAPSSATIAVDTGVTATVGGQYVAAAVAGVAASLTVSEPLTRKRVYGFETVEAIETAEMNNLAASGVLVVEETTSGTIRVRHGVTTDPSSKETAEWSVTGATDYVVAGLRRTLDESGFIGTAITNTTVLSVKGLVDSFLTSAVADSVIGEYSGLLVEQRPSEPDVIDVAVTIGFLYPLNRLIVTLTSSAATGGTTATVSEG